MSHSLTSRLARAQEYLREGKVEQAIIEYRAIQQSNPLNKWGWIGLIKCFLKSSATDEASSLIKLLPSTLSSDPMILLNVADIKIKEGGVDEAISILEEVRNTSDLKSDAHYHSLLALGRTYTLKKAFNTAEEFYRQATNLSIANVWAYIGLLSTLIAQGKTQQAYTLVSTHKLVYGAHPAFFVKKLELLLHRYEYEKTITEITRWKAQYAITENIRLKLIQAYLGSRKYSDALNEAKSLVKAFPDSVWGNLSLADAQLKADCKRACEKLLSSLLTKCDGWGEDNQIAKLSDLIDQLGSTELSAKWLNLVNESNTLTLGEIALCKSITISKKLKYYQLQHSLEDKLLNRGQLSYKSIIFLVDYKQKRGEAITQEFLTLCDRQVVRSDAEVLNVLLRKRTAGALPAYRLLCNTISSQIVMGHIVALSDVFIAAGKTEELKALLHKQIFEDNNKQLALIQLYTKVLRIRAEYSEAIYFLRTIGSENEGMKHMLSMELAHTQYSNGDLLSCMTAINSLVNRMRTFPRYQEALLCYCVVETLPNQQKEAWQQSYELLKNALVERKLRPLPQQIFVECFGDKAGLILDSALLSAIHTIKRKLILTSRDDTNSQTENVIIPKHIVQYWDKHEIPVQILSLCETWEQQPNYEYQRFSYTQAISFLRTHFTNDFVKAFRLCNQSAEQSDFFRLCYLYAKGGVYADCDDRLVGDLQTILIGENGLYLAKDAFGVGNNFIASIPKHPVIAATLVAAKDKLLAKCQENIWMKTGPGMLMLKLAEYSRYLETRNNEQATINNDVRIIQIEPTIIPQAENNYSKWVS